MGRRARLARPSDPGCDRRALRHAGLGGRLHRGSGDPVGAGRGEVDEGRGSPAGCPRRSLRGSPAVALPLVADAAKRKNGAWARTLAPQLERMSGVADVPDEGGAFGRRSLGRSPAGSTFKPPAFWPPDRVHAVDPARRRGPPACGSLAGLGGDRSRPTITDAIDALREAGLRRGSLAAFAWDLFQAWLARRALQGEVGVHGARALGDDEAARRLTPLIRAWPGESAHQRAVLGLDVLAGIGTDVALMMLNGIAQKVKFKAPAGAGPREDRRDRQARGLTAEELADRLVPGSRSRRRRLADARLRPALVPRRLRRGAGARTWSTPPARASGTCPSRTARTTPSWRRRRSTTWKAMKKDARTLAALQILRLELAMGNERRWSHGRLHGLPRRSSAAGPPGAAAGVGDLSARTARCSSTFRVAEDRSFADAARRPPSSSPADAMVGIAHRLELDDALVGAWSSIFADYELAQPFAQLGARGVRARARGA